MSALIALHADLPRAGPGDRDSLDWALGMARPPRNARICDAGCGPGADIAGLLDHAPDGHVLALDLQADFVERVATEWKREGRVTARQGDMADPGGPFDLIWSAGAVYHLGVTEALRGWRAALAPGGRVVFSELTWREAPSEAARRFWHAYPAMTDEDGVRARIDSAGYRLLDRLFLSPAAWRAYYGPLEERMQAARLSGPDPATMAAIDEITREIALWRDHGDEYGYLLCVVEPG